MNDNQMIEPMEVEQAQQKMTIVAEKLLQMAKSQGATAASVSVGNSQGLSIEVRHAQVETLEFNRDSGITVTVYLDQKKGSASTSDPSDLSLQRIVDAALSIAKYTGEDPFAGLAEAELYPESYPDLDLDHPWETSIEQLIDMAKETESYGQQVDERIVNSDGASLSSHENLSLRANSNGLLAFAKGSRHSKSCVLIAQDEQGMERDYYYTTARRAKDLLSCQEVGVMAGQRTVARLGAGKATQGYFPVIFSAEVAKGLIGHYLSATSGGSLYRKTTFLVDSLGKQVFPDWFELHEQPHLKRGLSSAVFDSDGVATRDKYLVQKGQVNSYLLSCYSARKLKMETTGNAGGAFNLKVSHGLKSQQQLISDINEGLLVTEVMGQGINLVNGDYSRGAGGFWIKNGKISHPVKEITIAGNLADMFKNIVEVGNDLDYRSGVVTGSILIDGMTVASQ